jgi:hypothetical protein
MLVFIHEESQVPMRCLPVFPRSGWIQKASREELFLKLPRLILSAVNLLASAGTLWAGLRTVINFFDRTEPSESRLLPAGTPTALVPANPI